MILSRIKDLIHQEKLLSKNDKILVSVSGGPDSIFLLHCLNNLKKIYNLKVYTLHINHNLRGVEAKRDENLVRETCSQLSLPLIIKSISVSDYQKKHKLSLEEAGRILRHKIYAQICASLKINKVFLAHTADDQVETILMNFIRGGLIHSLKGMNYQSNFAVKLDGHGRVVKFKVIRPLLNCFKEEIINYLKSNKLKFRVDKSNLNLKFTRNYLRHKIIPLLEKINPSFKVNLLKRAHVFNLLSNKFKKQIEKIIQNIKVENNQIEITFAQWKKLDDFLQRELIFMVLEKFFSLKDLNYTQIEDCINLINYTSVGKMKYITKDLIIYKDYDKIIISFYNALFKKKKIFRKKLIIPGETFIPEISAKIKINFVKKGGIENKNKIYLNYYQTGGNLFIRSRKKGDRFMPSEVRKKIQDFFVDQKVPLYLRDQIPLLVNDRDEVIWVIGLCKDKRFNVDKKTKKIIVVKFIK